MDHCIYQCFLWGFWHTFDRLLEWCTQPSCLSAPLPQLFIVVWWHVLRWDGHQLMSTQYALCQQRKKKKIMNYIFCCCYCLVLFWIVTFAVFSFFFSFYELSSGGFSQTPTVWFTLLYIVILEYNLMNSQLIGCILKAVHRWRLLYAKQQLKRNDDPREKFLSSVTVHLGIEKCWLFMN